MWVYTDLRGRTWAEVLSDDVRLEAPARERLLGPVEYKSFHVQMQRLRRRPATRKIERANG